MIYTNVCANICLRTRDTQQVKKLKSGMVHARKHCRLEPDRDRGGRIVHAQIGNLKKVGKSQECKCNTAP